MPLGPCPARRLEGEPSFLSRVGLGQCWWFCTAPWKSQLDTDVPRAEGTPRAGVDWGLPAASSSCSVCGMHLVSLGIEHGPQRVLRAPHLILVHRRSRALNPRPQPALQPHGDSILASPRIRIPYVKSAGKIKRILLFNSSSSMRTTKAELDLKVITLW